MGKKFFYQLKVEKPDSDHSFDRWEIIWCDILEAPSKPEARKIIEQEHGGVIAEKVLRKSAKKVDYRLFLIELTADWENHWLTTRECKVCKVKYSLLQAKQLNDYANYDVCSLTCNSHYRRENEFGDYQNSMTGYRPCIYKITNKQTGLCYIGQTTQAFTLRWYQHFFQSGENKFHEAIKSSKPSDWTFEVLEVIYESDFKAILNNREKYWIEHFDSITNGYNTANVAKAKADV